MVAVLTRQSQSISSEFHDRFAVSRERFQRAQTLIPGGVTHDGRIFRPFPVTVERAEGGHKWSVDGHELVDYAMGHGSLILGHNNPQIVRAIREQLDNGTHFGAGHDVEVRWADRVHKLIPSAEQVRFTMSGTEATLLALRLARAATGRTHVVKFAGHFHGWNDYMLKGERSLDDDHVSGVPAETLSTVDVLPADIEVVRARLAKGDVAAVILEPSGGSWSMVPFPDDDFLAQVREVTTANGTLLIFDEVITGFRWAPGGAQALYGVTPDLTTLAKILAGGLPGGAVAGRLEVMQFLAVKDDPEWNQDRKVRHMGTYNANPLSAAAGVACLDLVSDPEVQSYCDELAVKARVGMNQVLRRHGAPGFVWGDSSTFHVALGVSCDNTEDDIRRPLGIDLSGAKSGGKGSLAITLGQGMLLGGIDLFGGGGVMCVAHTEADIDLTINAFDAAIGRMVDEGLFA